MKIVQTKLIIIFRQNFEDSNKENKDKLIDDIILEKKDEKK